MSGFTVKQITPGDFAICWPKGVTWQGGPPSAVINTAVLGTIDGQVLRWTGAITGPVWVHQENTAETIKTLPNPCSFCADPTSAPPNKHGWHLCSALVCTRAAEAQAERMYAGLFDSPETRQAALTWVKNRG